MRQLDELGSFPIRFAAVPKGTTVYAFGYPAAGKYDGTKLTYCAGPVGFDAWNGNATYKLACDVTGGSSGGPWFVGFDEGTGSGTQISLNSYGYNGVKAMYGPKFDPATTMAAYDEANKSTVDTIVE
jgi:hypothetical protein